MRRSNPPHDIDIHTVEWKREEKCNNQEAEKLSAICSLNNDLEPVCTPSNYKNASVSTSCLHMYFADDSSTSLYPPPLIE